MATEDTAAARVVEEYLRVYYRQRADQEEEPRVLSPEEEEFAESDALLLERVRTSSAARQLMEAQINGSEPIAEISASGWRMRTYVERGATARGEPRLFAEVEAGEALAAVTSCSSSSTSVPWPAKLRFPLAAGTPMHAGMLWPSALRLATVLLADEVVAAKLLSPGARILELGAGVGLLGTVLALKGCEVTLTDHPDCGDVAAANVRANVPAEVAAANIRYEAVDWTQPIPEGLASRCPWDVVLCSDLLAYPKLHPALLGTLRALCAVPSGTTPSTSSQVLCAYESRCRAEEDSFFVSARSEFGFATVEEIRSPAVPLEEVEEGGWHLVRLVPG